MQPGPNPRRRSTGRGEPPAVSATALTTQPSMSAPYPASSAFAPSGPQLVFLPGQPSTTTTTTNTTTTTTTLANPGYNTLVLPANPPPLPRGPDEIHVTVRTPRAERITTSCGECRRRKQKCDQGRPCSNCVKRYPQPLCEYKPNKRRNPLLSHEPAFKVVLPSSDYDYATFSGIQGASLLSAAPLTQTLFLPRTVGGSPTPPSSTTQRAPTDLSQLSLDSQQQQQQQQNWALYAASAGAAGGVVLDMPGAAVPATATSVFGMLDTQGTLGGSSSGNSIWPPSTLFTDDGTAVMMDLVTDEPRGQPGYQPETDANDANRNADNDGTPTHGTVLADAFRLLQARRRTPDQLLGSASADNLDDLDAWLQMLTWTAPGAYGSGYPGHRTDQQRAMHAAGTHLYQLSGPDTDLAQLPLEATRLNADLVRIYVRLLARFKACLDGQPDAANPYTRLFVPYCLQTPLLAQVAVYTAACFLHETGHLDKRAAVAYKGRAIQLLNAQLGAPSSTTNTTTASSSSSSSASPLPTDDAITAVLQLIMDEWYWGQADHLQAHLRGLREMVRLRGGLRYLGMNGLIAKLAVASDMAIALSMEMAPSLQDGRNRKNSGVGGAGAGAGAGASGFFDMADFTTAAAAAAHVPFRVAHNTPLVAALPSFAQCADALKLHPTTASILDDMRFLIAAVLALPPAPPARSHDNNEKKKENKNNTAALKKVQTTAEWIHDRIRRLPADSPVRGEEEGGGGGAADGTRADADADTAAAAASLKTTRQPSIVLSEAEPLSDNTAQPAGNNRLGSTAAPSPRLRPGLLLRGVSGSPRLQPSTPPGSSTDGSSGANSRRGSTSPLQDPVPPAENAFGTAPRRPSSVSFPPPPPSTAAPDPLYQAVRQTALLYADAIRRRQPLRRAGLLGVFLWITVGIVASARRPAAAKGKESAPGTASGSSASSVSSHGPFVQSMLSICAVQLSLESWEVASGALQAAVRLNAWLAGGVHHDEQDGDEDGDEDGDDDDDGDFDSHGRKGNDNRT
ncbi:Zn(2)-C6 fungal-type DNA-binding domain protein [Niveomyces insectorum RCEF 264]|uniref:Zn(2)-C6 fungal-type DNA-binding domain protein n=1 Tax=Niveomyces insectorum RCEF 264 TaxID=1081102 RepID=A0A167UST0_9HYPO|nr:Zn(2)-C6 fungal-type DNA-binding domain protein [Niveomyces insectorum RCEF 264]